MGDNILHHITKGYLLNPAKREVQIWTVINHPVLASEKAVEYNRT